MKPRLVKEGSTLEQIALQELLEAGAALRAALPTAASLAASPRQLPWLRARALRLVTAVEQFVIDVERVRANAQFQEDVANAQRTELHDVRSST